MPIPSFEDLPPQSPELTPYDVRHLETYLLLLDADDAGIDWRSAVWTIFHVDAEREPERARTLHASHLARARWMTEHGYGALRPPTDGA